MKNGQCDLRESLLTSVNCLLCPIIVRHQSEQRTRFGAEVIHWLWKWNIQPPAPFNVILIWFFLNMFFNENEDSVIDS